MKNAARSAVGVASMCMVAGGCCVLIAACSRTAEPTMQPAAGMASPTGTPSPASPTPADRMTKESKVSIAMFGAGCFWGVEETFRTMPGVVKTAVGYAGGSKDNPTYKDVCNDTTGHAEVVQITYDPSKITYGQLLDTFWKCHDPTQINRQGPDYGEQYRTVIFYTSPEQQKEAQDSKMALAASGKWKRPIATAVQPAPTFWPAEEYHQQYLFKRGEANCHLPTGN